MASNQDERYRGILLLISQRNYAALYDFSEGIVIADKDGHIVYGNTSANTLLGRVALGVDPDDYSHRHGIFTEDCRPYPSTDLPLARAVLAGETVWGERMRVRRPDGSTITIECHARPLVRDDGDRDGGVAIFHEVV
jgi:PAS domain-containing protein